MTILELREKRAKAWEATKAFLDSHRNDKGMLSAEDDATYSRMEQEITDLGKEIARLERQEALDAELNRPVNKPLTGKPMNGKETAKTDRATDEYRQNFWNMMRSKTPMPTVMNALQIGTDSEGGYLVPDEYERTLVEALEEENIFRQLAKIIQTSSGDRKIVGWLCLFILIAGILGSARIVLGHHTLGEVLSGFAVGLICALLVLHPVSNILFRVFLF